MDTAQVCVGTPDFSHWFGGAGILLGDELRGTVGVRAIAVPMMQGARVRVEALFNGVHEVMVRTLLFPRSGSKNYKEGDTWVLAVVVSTGTGLGDVTEQVLG